MQSWLGQLGSDELPDALALHWYGTSFDDFQTYINTFSSAFPHYKLWITEFACTVSSPFFFLNKTSPTQFSELGLLRRYPVRRPLVRRSGCSLLGQQPRCRCLLPIRFRW